MAKVGKKLSMDLDSAKILCYLVLASLDSPRVSACINRETWIFQDKDY